MSIIRHILFPCDFSEQCSLAVPFVRALASAFAAKVTLLTVTPETAPGQEEATNEAPPHPEPVATQYFAGLAVESVAESGDPAQCILGFADDNAIDLIMMPTHGYALFRSLVIGSVTARVLHDAKCAVWTATHSEEQESAHTPRVILCAVDGSPKSLDLLRWAAAFSQQLGAELRVVHVAQRISDAFALPGERELQAQVNDQARSTIESLLLSAGVQAPVRVEAGSIADIVTGAAEEESADLIVIGRGTLQGALGRLRTHAYAIIQKAPCPVLSV